MPRTAVTNKGAPKSEYIETDTGNKISRKARIEGKANIILAGRSVIIGEVCLRGDLHRFSPSDSSEKSPSTTAISIGKYTVISGGTVLHPPCRLNRGVMSYYPIRIGDNVFIGPGCTISAASISSHVHIGANCILSPFCAVKENCMILPDTIVPNNMIIKAGSIVAGNPAQIVGEVGEGYGTGILSPGDGWTDGGDLRELVRSVK